MVCLRVKIDSAFWSIKGDAGFQSLDDFGNIGGSREFYGLAYR